MTQIYAHSRNPREQGLRLKIREHNEERTISFLPLITRLATSLLKYVEEFSLLTICDTFLLGGRIRATQSSLTFETDDAATAISPLAGPVYVRPSAPVRPSSPPSAFKQ